MQRIAVLLASTLALSAVACSDDDGPVDHDAGMTTGDAGTEDGGDGDGGTTGDEDGGTTGDEDGGTTGDEDGGTTGDEFAAITEVGAFDFTQANDLRAITYAADGTLYVAGYTDSNPDDRQLVVMHLTADGEVDTDFADDGVAVHNLVVDGFEGANAIVELENGDLVVAANADDGNGGHDVLLVKLDSDGALVDAFGTDGVLVVTFGWSEADDAEWPEAESAPSDTVYDLKVDTSGDDEKLVVMGYGTAPYDSEAETQRLDNDRYIVRLMADGSTDASFNGDGSAFSWDSGSGLRDNTRRGLVESDGAIVSGGYTSFPDAGDHNNVVLLRLLPDGTLDTEWGFGFDASPNGATKFNPFEDDGGMAEAYGVAQQSDGTYVTTGYGYATETGTGTSSMGYVTSMAQDLVSFGVKEDGSGLSTDFGKDDSGAWAYQSEEQSLTSFEERGRALVVLPDDRVAHAGYFGGIAAIYIALPDGALDTDQGEDGIFLFEDSDIDQQFFNMARSADGTRIAASTREHENGARVAILEVAGE